VDFLECAELRALVARIEVTVVTAHSLSVVVEDVSCIA